jgi:predicted dienelactone hydrolase
MGGSAVETKTGLSRAIILPSPRFLRRCGIRRLGVVAAGLAFVVGAAASACTSGSGTRDPAAPGPYGVGETVKTFTRSSSITGEPRVLDTVIWYPTDDSGEGGTVRDAAPATSGGPFPVVMFSHGACGTPTQSTYFTEHLASWGFVVVAPPHPGNVEGDCPCEGQCLVDSYNNRVDDLSFALESVLALADDPVGALGAIIDPERAAVTGFSFGGLDAVRAASEGRFDAVVALAPGAPLLLIDAASRTRVPAMLMAGGKDWAVDSGQVTQLYRALPNDIPRYLIVLPEGGHHSFQDDCTLACDFPQERAHELVNRYATAFLETHLVGDENYRRYLEVDEAPDALLTHDGE